MTASGRQQASKTRADHLRAMVTPSPNFEPGEHKVEDLGDFTLPELKVPQATFEEALDALLEEYTFICLRTRQEPLDFRFEVPEGLDQRQDIHLTNRSFQQALQTLAIAYGLKLNWKEDGQFDLVKISDLPPSNKSPIQGRQWALPSNFKNYLEPYMTPNESVATDEGSTDISTTLKRFGWLRGDEVSVELFPTSSQLIMRSNRVELAELYQLMETFYGLAPSQQIFSNWMVTSPDEIALLEKGFLTLAELDEAMPPHAEVLSLPEVVARRGESAEVSLIQGDVESDWTGLTYSVSSEGYGFGVRESSRFEYRPGGEPIQLGENGTAFELPSQVVKENSDIAPPQRHALVERIPTDQGVLYMVTSTMAIDVTGRAVYPEDLAGE
ncbi:hypothetical protein [Roseibacillus persicicus]|nr:hypothetical protein [Roseibacillus persicicus]